MLEGKVALVTGGCRGIGAAITENLAAAGAHVAAGYNHGEEAARALAGAQATLGRSVSVHQGNVAEPTRASGSSRRVLDQHGRVDFLVNNAGITSTRRCARCRSTTGMRSCE